MDQEFSNDIPVKHSKSPYILLYRSQPILIHTCKIQHKR